MREKHFGPAQEKKPGFLQREVKALEDPPLCFGIEIHDGVAANEQIQARDRGVLNQVVSAENNAAAQFRLEDVPFGRVREILLQIFLWNGLDLFLAVTAGAGFAESRFIHVRGVDLHALAESFVSKSLSERKGQRVGLFAGGTACAPDAHRRFRLLKDARNDLLRQEVPGLGIPVEARDVDEDCVEQETIFFGMHLQVILIVRKSPDADLMHSFLNSAADTGPLIACKVKAARALEKLQQRLKLPVRLRALHGGIPPLVTKVIKASGISVKGRIRSTLPV